MSNSIWQRRTKSCFTDFVAKKNTGNCEPLLQKAMEFSSIAIYIYVNNINTEYSRRHKTSLRHRVLLASNKVDSIFADWDMPNSSHM